MATKAAHLRAARAFSTWDPAQSYPERQVRARWRLACYLAAKRLTDVLFSATLLIVLWPLMVLIGIAVMVDSPGPAIFFQNRVRGDQSPGRDHPERSVFCFLKFRTMFHGADPSAHEEYMRRLIEGEAEATDGLFKLRGDARITRVGRWLRRTSLDELPQLVNILLGDMSFVGPRPAIPYEVARYRPAHFERLTVPQGLTGLWQVMGRNELSFDDMVALDVRYARSRSFFGDLRLLLATIPAVLSGRGVS